MDERRVVGAALFFGLELVLNGVVPVYVDEHAGHLEVLGELVDGRGDHIFLTVAVEENHLAEAGVPEAGHHGLEHADECVLGHEDGAWHAHVVKGVRAVPQRLGEGATGAFGHLLGHARDQERVFARACVGAVGLGASDGQNDEVVLFEALFDVRVGHILEIDGLGAFHAALGRGQFPAAPGRGGGGLRFLFGDFLIGNFFFICLLVLFALGHG